MKHLNIDFYFDENNRICWIDDPWDIKMPAWSNMQMNVFDIKKWFQRDYNATGKYVEGYKLLDHIAQQYNL